MGFLAIQKTKGTYTSLNCVLFNSERHQVSMKRHALRMLKHRPPSWILCRNAFEHLVMPVCWQPTCCEEPSYVCMYHRHHRHHRPSWKPWKILADPERTQSMLLESNCADRLLISLVIWSCALFLCSTSPSQCFHTVTVYSQASPRFVFPMLWPWMTRRISYLPQGNAAKPCVAWPRPISRWVPRVPSRPQPAPNVANWTVGVIQLYSVRDKVPEKAVKPSWRRFRSFWDCNWQIV